MAKGKKSVFFCQNCGHEEAKWLGQCPGCGEWNTFVEEKIGSGVTKGSTQGAKAVRELVREAKVIPLNDVTAEDDVRCATGIKELDRIVTIAYLTLVKIDRRFEQLSDKYDACWTPVTEVKSLAFDHFQILQDALVHIRHYVEYVPSAMFDLLPRKFTAAQLRTVYQLIYDKVFDVRNFHKKIALMPYVVPLEEKQVGVCHRGARFYKFDRSIYNKSGTK